MALAEEVGLSAKAVHNMGLADAAARPHGRYHVAARHGYTERMNQDFYDKLFAPDMQEELRCSACDQRRLAYAGYDGRLLYFECEGCGQQYTLGREELKKKLVYLDQWALSLMQKTNIGDELNVWRGVLRRLSNLSRNQVIVCPHSIYHMYESEMDSRLADDLYALFKFLGDGIRFEHPNSIEINQIGHMLDVLDRGEPPVAAVYPSHDALPDSPHRPSEDILIDVNWRLTKDDIEAERRMRDATIAKWERAFAEASEHERSHPIQLADRLGSRSGQDVLNAYLEPYRRYTRMMNDEEPVDFRPLFAATNSREYHMGWTVRHCYERKGLTESAAVEKAAQFFTSRHYMEMPFVRIASLLIAAVIRKQASGRKPQRSDIGDINMIRCFAPYCDAMLVDRAFHALATEAPIEIDKRYGVRFFSSRTREEFLCWLEDAETAFLNQLRPREHGEIPDQRLGARVLKKFGDARDKPASGSATANSASSTSSAGSEQGENGCSKV